jgi:hypothetical protein
MSDPYDRTKAPRRPREPARFSPLRPLRVGLWWWLTLRMWDDAPPAGLVALGACAFVGLGLGGLCIAALGFPSSTPDGWPAIAAASGAALFALSELVRSWLRAALHLDDPAAFDAWEARLTR